MARGFNITVSAKASDEINEESLAAELAASGQLSELEKDGLFPGAMKAAKDLCDTIGEGPFLVTFSGVDRTHEKGEQTILSVSVSSQYTYEEPVLTDEEKADEKADAEEDNAERTINDDDGDTEAEARAEEVEAESEAHDHDGEVEPTESLPEGSDVQTE